MATSKSTLSTSTISEEYFRDCNNFWRAWSVDIENTYWSGSSLYLLNNGTLHGIDIRKAMEKQILFTGHEISISNKSSEALDFYNRIK